MCLTPGCKLIEVVKEAIQQVWLKEAPSGERHSMLSLTPLVLPTRYSVTLLDSVLYSTSLREREGNREEVRQLQ